MLTKINQFFYLSDSISEKKLKLKIYFDAYTVIP